MEELQIKFPSKQEILELKEKAVVDLDKKGEEYVDLVIWKFCDIDINITIFWDELDKFHLYIEEEGEIGMFNFEDFDSEYEKAKQAAQKAFKTIVKQLITSVNENNERF